MKVNYRTIEELFDYCPGNFGLTEEIIYTQKPSSDEENIPIFSGSDNNELPIGYIRNPAFTKDGKSVKVFIGPAIILTKDGSAGLLTYKPEGVKFTINHHACVLKKKYIIGDDLNEQWFCQQYQSELLRVVTSKSDNRIFSTEWFSRLKLPIPEDSVIQKELFERKYRLILVRKELLGLLDDILITLKRPNKNIKGEIAKASQVLDVFSGNSGITEEFIYKNAPSSDDFEVELISSATLATNSMGRVKSSAKLPSGDTLKVFEEEAIIIARNGCAGKLTYINDKRFATTDHAYVIQPKEEWKERLNLRWFSYQYEPSFMRVTTSQSGNATFNKEWLDRIEVVIPERQHQERVASKLNKLDAALMEIGNLIEQINAVLLRPFDLKSVGMEPKQKSEGKSKKAISIYSMSAEEY